jgi:DNA-binding CsgD family transcriptional regulator
MDSPGMTAFRVLADNPRPADASHPFDRLNRTELKVLQQLSVDASNEEIAHRLYFSEQVVRNHVLHILEKLELANRRDAARLARRNGLRAA